MAFYKSYIHVPNHHHLHLIYFHSLHPPSLDQFLCSFFPSSIIFFTFSPYLFSSLTPFSLPTSIHCIASSMVNCSAHLLGIKFTCLKVQIASLSIYLHILYCCIKQCDGWSRPMTITLHYKFNFKLATKLCNLWSHKFMSHIGLIWTLWAVILHLHQLSMDLFPHT